MASHTLIVISDPDSPQLTILEGLRREISLAVGNSAEALGPALPEADAILNWVHSNHVLREIFGKCPRLRWVHARSAGVDQFLFPELVASPVTVTNSRGVFSAALGEFALAAILYFAKDFRRMIRNQAAGVWESFDVEEVEGRTVCIVGYGDIGRAVAARARAFGMKVLAVKRQAVPRGADPLADEVFGPERRAEAISRSDYIVASAPLTPETRGLIGAAEIAAMKPTAVVINVGRGDVIDEPSLVAALAAKRIRGAALDVFSREPLPAGHPFYKLENVLLSPHCADHTTTWEDDAMRFFLAQFERYRKNRPLLSVVNKERGY